VPKYIINQKKDWGWVNPKENFDGIIEVKMGYREEKKSVTCFFGGRGHKKNDCLSRSLAPSSARLKEEGDRRVSKYGGGVDN